MLVLSRKTNERIVIGEDIELKVLSVQGNRVRLGITCPKEIRILRSEIGNSHSTPEATLEISNP